MLPIYIIEKISQGLKPNIRVIDNNKISNNAVTHYAYKAYLTMSAANKIIAGFVPRPSIQYKTSKDARPVAEITVIAEQSPARTKEPRGKSRQNINKDAIAKYFDIAINDATIDQEKWLEEMMASIAQEEWLEDVMTELDTADKIKEQADAALHQELQQYAAERATHIKQDDTDIRQAQERYTSMRKAHQAAIAAIEEQNKQYAVECANQINAINEYLAKFDAKEATQIKNEQINASVTDRFIKKYNGADTAAASARQEKIDFAKNTVQETHNNKKRSKRKPLKKAALAQAILIQPVDKPIAWLMWVVAELDAADKAKEKANAALARELRTENEIRTARHATDWNAYGMYIWYRRKMHDAEQEYIENAASKNPKDYDSYIAEINNYLAEFDAKER